MWSISIAIFAGIVIILAKLYSSFNYKICKTENAKAELKLQLEKRFDIVPSIVDLVKTIDLSFENLHASSITHARHKYMSSYTFKDVAEANSDLTLSLKDFFALIRNHDAVVVDKNFLSLTKELSKIENKVNFTREIYNSVADDMNNYRKKQLISIFSKFKKLESYHLFDEKNSILDKSEITF